MPTRRTVGMRSYTMVDHASGRNRPCVSKVPPGDPTQANDVYRDARAGLGQRLRYTTGGLAQRSNRYRFIAVELFAVCGRLEPNEHHEKRLELRQEAVISPAFGRSPWGDSRIPRRGGGAAPLPADQRLSGVAASHRQKQPVQDGLQAKAKTFEPKDQSCSIGAQQSVGIVNSVSTCIAKRVVTEFGLSCAPCGVYS
jgi:hypothetical protein